MEMGLLVESAISIAAASGDMWAACVAVGHVVADGSQPFASHCILCRRSGLSVETHGDVLFEPGNIRMRAGWRRKAVYDAEYIGD